MHNAQLPPFKEPTQFNFNSQNIDTQFTRTEHIDFLIRQANKEMMISKKNI